MASTVDVYEIRYTGDRGGDRGYNPGYDENPACFKGAEFFIDIMPREEFDKLEQMDDCTEYGFGVGFRTLDGNWSDLHNPDWLCELFDVVFKKFVEEEGIEGEFELDSCPMESMMIVFVYDDTDFYPHLQKFADYITPKVLELIG